MNPRATQFDCRWRAVANRTLTPALSLGRALWSGRSSPAEGEGGRYIARVVVLLAALNAAGCTVGPDYVQPQINVPAQWTETSGPNAANAATTAPATSPATQPAVSVATVRPADTREWWKSFHDNTLDGLIEHALSANLDIGQAEARIRAARAQQIIAAAGLLPTLNASASATRRNDRGSFSEASSLFRAGFDSAWELDVFGGTRRGVEAATSNLQFAFEDRRDVIVTLTAEIATDYFDLRGAQQQLEIAKRNLQSQQQSVQLTRQRHAGGFVSQLDVANSEAQVASTQARIPSLEATIHASIHALGVLLAEEPGDLLSELGKAQPPPIAPPEVPVGLPSDLLRRRPDIRRAEANLHAATAQIGVATADLFPKFSLTGSLGVQGSTLGALGNSGNSLWSIGPSVTWPIFAGGAIRGNIDLQRALTDESYLAYQQTVLVALQEVEDGLVNFATEQQRRSALIDSVRSNREAVDLATQLYQAGRTDFLNVLTAQRALLDAEDALAQSDAQIVSDLVAIYKALGGGWETAADEQKPASTR